MNLDINSSPIFNFFRVYYEKLVTSVPNPWHFAANPDPRIRTLRLQLRIRNLTGRIKLTPAVLSYRPVRLHRLADWYRYDNPMPESTMYPICFGSDSGSDFSGSFGSDSGSGSCFGSGYARETYTNQRQSGNDDIHMWIMYTNVYVT